MGWKKNRQPKQSISSVTSMSFLTDQNLTFHRFSDGTISFDGMKTRKVTQHQPNKETHEDSLEVKRKISDMSDYQSNGQQQPVWTTKTNFDYSTNNPCTLLVDESATSTTKILPDTESGAVPSVSSEYHYSTACNNSTTSTHPQHNGSTMKLIAKVTKDDRDQSSKQSRCSIFRGVVLCLCLNMTYANIVRFPRELERHGIAFLVPYLILLLIVGLPIVLLEISLGQFLGQGSAHSWKASPLFKGACILGRIGSWLASVWISMQAGIALLYIGKLFYSKVPFPQCPSSPQIIDTKYQEIIVSGQECLRKTFLRPVWDYSLSFGLLAISLIFLWVIIMLCTTSSKINRRSIFFFGFFTLSLLLFLTGWHVHRSISTQDFPEMWPFKLELFQDSSTWFYALIQVIFSTNIGVGALPVLTGKFLYKGDAVRTSFVYICFNLLIATIATTFYMTQFSKYNTTEAIRQIYPDLSTITIIYDRSFSEHDVLMKRLIPGLAFLMIVLAAVITISIFIYTSSRLMRRHPNYIMCLAAMFVSIACLICPHFTIVRMLDFRIVGIIIICALIFDIIGIAWIYGYSSLFTDLEFSIGRPIMKLWLVLWSIIPLILAGILAWWTFMSSEDVIEEFMPRWAPIVVCLGFIVLLACYEVSKQVDYNLISMIHEATRPAKDWGPGDPLVRHAWKQWKSVCDDTGERDFTLRRRGTKDYTSSIKKGQYSHANKYSTGLNGKNSSTTNGSNSPNYSGSVFGDSAIEEDISCDKYANQLEYSHDNRSRKSSTNTNYKRQVSDASSHRDQRTYVYQHNSNYHSQKIPIRVPSARRDQNTYSSRIEITPQETPFQPSLFLGKNPLSHLDVNSQFMASTPYTDKYGNHHQQYQQQDYIPRGNLINNIHIESSDGSGGSPSTKTTNTTNSELYPWRKFAGPREPVDVTEATKIYSD